MKTLACADVGGFVCDYIAEGETDGEVMAKLKEHGIRAHLKGVADMMSKMSEKDLEAKMKSLIKEAPASGAMGHGK